MRESVLNSLNIETLKSKGIFFNGIDKDKLSSEPEINYSKLSGDNDEGKRKKLQEMKNEIELKIKNILSNSEESIKSTVPIINNVNKQLMQDNLLLKIKIESMKQVSKNILNHCNDLKARTLESDSQELKEVLDSIVEKFKNELQKVKEE